MLTTGKGTHYCQYCGFDMKAREDRMCSVTDGDVCIAKKRTPVKKKPVKKTITIVIEDHKDPDVWGDVIDHFKMSYEDAQRHFDFAEYASLELEIDEKMNIVGGRILPR